MAKSNTLWLQLTPTEANALMVMLDSEIESCHNYGGGIDLSDWENLDLEAYKLLAFRTFKKWYMENCADE
jgi:hypothetical protein